MAKRLNHIQRSLTDEERRQAEIIRKGAEADFPLKSVQRPPSPPGIPSRIQEARKQRRLTRYELGKLAQIPATAIRAIEEGDDVPLSQFHAVATALGLTIELVEQTA